MGAKFFKIVVNPQDHRLRIPSEFVRGHGHNLPDKITLKVLHGPIRELGLVRSSNGDTWFHKGWQEFQGYYKTDFGHLLVFEFNGKSHFNVVIFDTTAMEIQYPLDDEDEGINFNRADRRVIKTEVHGSESDDSDLEKVDRTAKIIPERKKRSKSYSQNLKNKIKKQCGGTQGEQLQRVVNKRCIAYEKAETFKNDNPTENPFHISIMQPSYVAKDFILNVPVAFAKEYLPEKLNNLTLRALDGKTWCIKCHIGKHSGKITSGWKKLVEDSDLNVGDVCVFEVIKSPEQLLWNVRFSGAEGNETV